MSECLNKSICHAKRIEDDGIYYFVRPIKKILSLKNKKVEENCPYFFEHQISDLYKGK